MTGFHKQSAVGMIASFRRADVAATESAAGLAGVDHALIAKKSELRQSLLAILEAAIDADLCPAHALEVFQQTSGFMSGAAMRFVYEDEEVPWGAVEVMGRSVIESVAKGAGRMPIVVPTRSAKAPSTHPTHTDHKTRQ